MNRQVLSSSPAWRNIFTYFCIIIIDIMSINVVAPVLAPLVNDPHTHVFGAHTTEVSRHVIYGLIQALSPLCYMFGAPILGYFSDRIGRKKVLLLCIIGSLIGLIAYAVSFALSNLLILLVGRIIVGFTAGSLAVAQSAMADMSNGANKAKNMGVIAVAMTIGLIAGPLLGGVFSDPSVVSWFNNTMPFYVGICLSLLNLLILLTLLTETHPKEKTQQSHNLVSDFIQLIFRQKIHFILLTFFVFELGWSLYFQSLALLLAQTFQVSNKIIGLFSAYIGLLLSFFLLYGVRLAVNRYALTTLIKPSFLLGTLVLLLGFLIKGLLMQWLIAIPLTLMVAYCYTILITLGSDKIDADMQGLYMGTTDSLLSLAFAITAFLGSVVAIHDALMPQLIAAGLFLLGFFIFPLARKQYSKE